MRTVSLDLDFLRVCGAGGALPGIHCPGAILSNERLSALHAEASTRLVAAGLDEMPPACDPDFARSRVGIETRCVADRGCTAADLAQLAAGRAVASTAETLGIQPAEVARRVRAIVVSSVTGFDPVPAIATHVAAAIGCEHDVAAFDVVLGCNGFIAAAASVGSLLRGHGRDALGIVVGAETMTRVLDATDRNTLPIFGDGAGALVVQANESAPAPAFRTMPEFGPRIRIEPREPSSLPLYRITSDGGVPCVENDTRSPLVVRMDGRRVFRDMVRTLPRAMRETLGGWGAGINDFDHLAFHQANARLLEGVYDGLGVDRDACLMNIAATGNTTSASIPLLLNEAARDGRWKSGQRVLLVGFGTGYSIGITSLSWH